MRRCLGIVGALVVVACSGAGGQAAKPPAPVSPSASAAPLLFVMQGVNDGAGKVTGSASVAPAEGSFSLTIRLTGLAPGSNHIAHIHRGSCAVNGGIVLALTPVVADTAGNGTSTTAFMQPFKVPADGWYANVHNGPDLSTPQNARSLACADLRNP